MQLDIFLQIKRIEEIEEIEDKEELDKYIKVFIENYHLQKWKQRTESKELLKFMESKNYDKFKMSKVWKKITLTNRMHKVYTLIQENAFITPYKSMLINKENKENDKGSKKNSDTKINKFVEKELELARKLGIESYIKI